jgi:hypothetical protein
MAVVNTIRCMRFVVGANDSLEGVDALGGAFEEVVAGFGAEGAVVDYEFFLFAGAAGAP